MDIHAVLLIPAEGDPLGLLASGPCGARPPTRIRHILGDCSRRWGRMGNDAEALVLAWDGKPVAEGCDRLMRCVGGRPYNWMTIERLVEDWRIIAHVEGWGTIVLLDSEGHEVTP